MTEYYLCDMCGRSIYRENDGYFCCIAPGMGRISAKHKKAFEHGCDDPKAVCPHFEPKEGEWPR